MNIQQVDFTAHFEIIRHIRETVFVQEQNVPIDMEWDEFDAQAVHILAYVQGQAVGTARFLHDGSISRVAVLKQWRGLGVGRQMVLYLTALAKQRQYTKVHLHAQVSAFDFYQKLGFELVGDTFEEAGILHQVAVYYF